MLFEEFGRHIDVHNQQIEDALSVPAVVDGITANVLYREAYDTAYKIYDHDRPDSHPWAMVLSHDKEDYWESSRYWNLLSRYREYRVNERFHLDWITFLRQPRPILESILDQARHERNVEAKAFSEMGEGGKPKGSNLGLPKRTPMKKK